MGCTKLSVVSLLCGHHLCIWKKRQGKSSCMHNLHFGWTLVRVRQAGPLPEGASSQPHGQHAPDPCHFLLATAQPLRAVSPTHSSSTTACRSGNREPILSKTNLRGRSNSSHRASNRAAGASAPQDSPTNSSGFRCAVGFLPFLQKQSPPQADVSCGSRGNARSRAGGRAKERRVARSIPRRRCRGFSAGRVPSPCEGWERPSQGRPQAGGSAARRQRGGCAAHGGHPNADCSHPALLRHFTWAACSQPLSPLSPGIHTAT